MDPRPAMDERPQFVGASPGWRDAGRAVNDPATIDEPIRSLSYLRWLLRSGNVSVAGIVIPHMQDQLADTDPRRLWFQSDVLVGTSQSRMLHHGHAPRGFVSKEGVWVRRSWERHVLLFIRIATRPFAYIGCGSGPVQR